MHRSIATVALVLALGALGACAEQGGDAMPGTEPTAARPRPTNRRRPRRPGPRRSRRAAARATPSTPGSRRCGRPTAKQSLPTDYIPGDTLSGRVTKGGSGPCYGLVTDDEVQYALHSTAGITLEEGTYVLVKVAPLRLKIYCGPGAHLALLKATKL